MANKIPLPPLSNGMDYFIDDDGKKVCRGARMGRSFILPVPGTIVKFRLYRLRFVDGDYDQGGAYWGSPANVWRAVSIEQGSWISNWDGSLQKDFKHYEVFVRANSREEAKQKVCSLSPRAKFYR